MQELKDRLLTARQLAGLTQQEVADAVGITQPSYALVESGKSYGSKHLVKIALALGVTATWLATGEGEMKDQLVPVAGSVMLDSHQVLGFLKNLLMAESHLAQACSAVGAPPDCEQNALHQRVSAILADIEALSADLQPTILLKNNSAVHRA
ncbi:helix-turn-helix transcriptional regulator [Microbulbifer salipaludis]|uniref:Helix-turn-helix transcriptional regulator n=1 Tax=Microbulbifer salipaludis TaxID=187980 RepID=A0ABS3E933_9GAMM|nr:helix-turn-helix transcriptional regulator [Microbulbifer salipaludis]MBN8431828.1 helix-turn-helix transcriptional regulator [Microbulbifer salipaludis]